MRHHRALSAAAALLVVMAAAGCGGSSGGSTGSAVNPGSAEVNPAGDIPDNQAFVRYAPPGAGYSVKVPEGWSRSGGGAAAVVFTDKLNAIGLSSARAARAPTTADGRQALATLARSLPGFRAGTVAVVPRTAGPAVRITYLATGRPNAVTGRRSTDAVERYVFFHRGRDAIVTLSGPKGADNVDPWRTVTDSLRWWG